MRLPNGYGTVYKLSGNRRRPWIARKTTGWTDEGEQVCQTIGYYKTRQEALTALSDYNKNPYSVEASTVTFEELFERLKNEKFDKISRSNQLGYTAAFKKSEKLHQMRFVDVKHAHLQSVIDNCDKGWGTKKKIKVLFNQMYAYALKNDIDVRDYSKFVDLGRKDIGKKREVFTGKEINLLWDHVERMDYIDAILIMIYTGMRPGELITIKNQDINLEERYLRGGIKNENSMDRVIPLNEKIVPLIEKRMSSENEFFIANHKGEQMRYWNFYEEKWKRVMEQLQLSHRPHDCRHTFASLMDSAGANKVCIKRIMGHASKDITDKVYTHKDIRELIIEINKI
ncbi:tyrosine-type recombinase/integrase [Tindallia californiensis]|uniref:Phage integrase family protein n=1 Tax=Tindallia californiensis TaxID=159292 RepID=A0A1H3R014_9FIRM|nr:site-specific integrase [Tindallia californiensis]SDZ18645.1 Phage integrase family protein [Tindallia californiensis]